MMNADRMYAALHRATIICVATFGGNSTRYHVAAEARLYSDVGLATCTLRVDRAFPPWTGLRGVATTFARSVSNPHDQLLDSRRKGLPDLGS
eukprot:8604472-Pyramimonas_sp.AAC.1